jgi:hypothetical protein
MTFLGRRINTSPWISRGLLALKQFLVPFAVSGVVFSALQIWLAFSDDFEGTSRTIREIEIELARLRTVVDFLKPAPPVEVAIFIILLVLLAAPAAISIHRVSSTFNRYLRLISMAYVWLSLLTSLTFFGAITASDSHLLAQRIATLERHVQRIEKRYAKNVDTAALTLGAEWFQDFVLWSDEDSEHWWMVIAFANDLDQYTASMPGSYPGLFGEYDGGGPPTPPPGTDPTSPAAMVAALALLERPNERLALRFKGPLLQLRGTLGAELRPVAERGPAPSPPLLPNVFASELAAQFPVHARNLSTPPTKLARESPGERLHATREEWSEEKAANAEEELNDFKKASGSKARSNALFSAIGARLAAAGYETQADRVLDALKDVPELGIPLGIIAAFVEAVVNDTAKAWVEDATNRATENWLRGRSFAHAARDFRREASAGVRLHSSLRLRERLAALHQRLEDLLSRWEVGKEDIRRGVKVFASDNVVARWSAFEEIWNQAAAQLPTGTRENTLMSLSQMNEAFQHLDVPTRLTTLDALEEVWLAAPNDELSRIGAMLRCEALMGLQATAFEKALVEVLPSMLSRVVSRTSEVEALADTAMQGADIEPAQRANIIEALMRKRAQALRTPSAGASFVEASRASSPTQARKRYYAKMGTVCVLNGWINTYHVVNGVKIGPVARRRVALPCF